MRHQGFAEVMRLLRLAANAQATNQSSEHAVESSRDARRVSLDRRKSRRDFIVESSRLAALAAGASMLDPARAFASGSPAPNLSVGIVGAGLAGLACADALERKGIVATVYEASDRVGGRCYSLPDFFPGQIAERGGEYIDNRHKTMLRYAKELKLSLEDVTKQPGDVFYYFNGQHYDESEVVDAFRDFVPVMRDDLRRLSAEVTAFASTPDDRAIDRTSLAEYLAGSNSAGVPAPPLVRVVLEEAYKAEYGLEPGEQSALNFLMFIHADRRSKFTPFGVSSDERWHIVEGNDRIPSGLAARLESPFSFGMTLVAARRTAAGRIELTFESGGGTITRVHDTVVITLPFSVLRDVQLDVSLNLSAGQQLAIDTLGYGTNAKMMVGFDGRPWTNSGGNGTAYVSLPNVQTTWETNPTAATASRGVLTDYSSGDRGARLDPSQVQIEALRFLTDLDLVFPGALSAATQIQNSFLAHLEAWPSNPLSKGSYTCYRPGQFTTLAGYEGLSAGPLHFAGEHANSFYVWQGFMEGAVLSGLDAAKAVRALV